MDDNKEMAYGDVLIRARNDLARTAEELAGITREMGDTFNTSGLRLLIPRLKQGLVRVAVIGATSSGKSTLINAVLKSLVVPENPNVSSPIPVWIGYQEGEPKITIYKSREEDPGQNYCEECSIVEFQTEYCYNADHIRKRDLDQFQHVRYGAVGLESECLRNGMVFIDTLGISATDIDTAKTRSVLEEGVDLVLFVTKNNSFTQTEVEFLQSYVLGVCPEKRQVVHPVMPGNILFAINPFGLISDSVKSAVETSIQKVFAPCGVKQEELDVMIQNNVFYVHAQKGRYGECGVYPYEERAPKGAADKEKEFLAKKQQEEQELLSRYGVEYLLADSGISSLRKGLWTHVLRQSYGVDSAVVRRIRELSMLADKVQLAAARHLSDASSVTAALEKTKTELDAQQKVLKNEKEQIGLAMNLYKEEYISSLFQIYAASYQRMKAECVGYARNYSMPAAFTVKWDAFRQMNNLEKQQIISAFLPILKNEIHQYCKDTVLKLLEINEPGKVLEKSRKFIQNASEHFSACIKALEESEALQLGIPLPAQETVNALYGQLKSDLDEGVSGAINHSLAEVEHRFHKKMDDYVKAIRWGWLGVFNFLPHGQNAFWAKVQSQVLVPLANQLVDEVISIAKNTEAAQSALAVQVGRSYDHVKDELRDNLTGLTNCVQIRVRELEKMIKDQTKETEDELARYQRLKAGCQELIQRLNGWNEDFLGASGD